MTIMQSDNIQKISSKKRSSHLTDIYMILVKFIHILIKQHNFNYNSNFEAVNKNAVEPSHNIKIKVCDNQYFQHF